MSTIQETALTILAEYKGKEVSTQLDELAERLALALGAPHTMRSVLDEYEYERNNPEFCCGNIALRIAESEESNE